MVLELSTGADRLRVEGTETELLAVEAPLQLSEPLGNVKSLGFHFIDCDLHLYAPTGTGAVFVKPLFASCSNLRPEIGHQRFEVESLRVLWEVNHQHD